MKRIIITADDYGMCVPVDKAIDDCIEAGLLTSTNVIVNMEDLEAVKTIRQRYPQISIGMHWNVTKGKPISQCKTLINPQTGEFWGVKDFIQKYKNGSINKGEFREELLAQYDIFKVMCGDADYWNVHMNSSLDFETFSFFNILALELGIKKTRSFQRVYVNSCSIPGGLKNCLVEVVKKVVMDIWFGWQIPKTGTSMPDGRLMYFKSDDKTRDIHNVGKNIKWNGKSIVELVIHPATVSDHPGFGTLTTERVKEWKMFTDVKTKQYFHDQGIEIVTFEAIK